MSQKLKQTQINDLVRPFLHLLDATMNLCHNKTTFRVEDLYKIYYQKTSGLKHDQQALLHVARSYVSDLTSIKPDVVNTEETETLCIFFLETMSVNIVDQSIRSMFRCLQINPFTIDTSYSRFLTNTQQSTYDQSRASVFRTSSMILLLNDIVPVHIADLVRLINSEQTDSPLALVFAQYLVRHISNGVFSVFNGETPFITNITLVKNVLKFLHRSGELYIRPYKMWDQRYMHQAMLLQDFFNRLSTMLRSDKDLMVECSYFYPDEKFGTEYIANVLKNDVEIRTVLQRRHERLMM